MYAVGRLGSYITQGVYTVSGPFHPFGGAVDIIVVEQPDGSFKSSPWYVRFGKFQGVLKARQQVVTITVNGVETNIHMYLDPRGEAYFLREVEGEEGESVSYCSSSSDDMDGQSQKNRRPMESKSCNYDGSNSNLGDHINASNGNILARNDSCQSRISGLLLEQRSIKEEGYQEGGDGARVVRISSLEHAEIAANLVEKFMLNESDLGEKWVEISEISRKFDEPSTQYADEDIDAKDVIPEFTCSDSDIADTVGASPGEKLDEKQASDKKDVQPGFHVSEEELMEISEISRKIDEPRLLNADQDNDAVIVIPEVTCSDSEIADVFEAFPCEKLDEKQFSVERDVELPGFHISEEESESSRVQSFIHCETSESLVVVLDGSKEKSEIGGGFEACPDEKLGEEQASDERDVVLPGFGVSAEESGSSSIQSSSMQCETSESPGRLLDGSKEQSEITGVFEACLDKKLGKKKASDGVSVEESGSSSVQSSIHFETSESSIVGLDGSKEQSEIAGVFEACSGKKGETRALDEKDVELPGFGVSEEESGSSRVQSFIYCETSESSIMGLDGVKGESEGTLPFASGGCREVHFCAETLHVTTDSLAEDAVNQQDEDIELEREDIESCGGYSQQMNPSTSMYHDGETNLEPSLTLSTSYAQTAYVDPVLGSTQVESKTISFNTTFGNSVSIRQDEIDNGDKITRNELQLSLDSVGDSKQLNGDYTPRKVAPIPVSESSEEEQFFFSDIDDFELRETLGESNFPYTVGEESSFPDAADEENHPSICPEGIGILNGSLNAKDGSYSSPDDFVQKNRLGEFENFTEKLKLASSPIDISKRHSVASAEDGRMTESLPDLWSHMDNLVSEDLHHPLSYSLDLNSESLEWELHDKNESPYAKSDTGNESQSAQEYSNKEDTYQLEDTNNGVGNPAAGDPSKAIGTTGGSWSLWPFPFRRSRSRKTVQPTVNDTRISDRVNVSNSNICSDNKRVLQRKASKKMVKAMTPTSKELASLNLKEGSNAVTFTFSTAMLGRQKVDARIYLWKWNTRIVISDVDGTITKSDVLGQFMPLVGVDWSQTGVAHLFSAIKDNGYQFLYLSARAIAQAYITRQFLVNLKQDGKALPDGPVVISPDGLFPSLFREVIRRAPHEFKIACLEDIRALFPSDCNPFYAGFGNRDTDEISYLKVGIPRGKIFIINPKGEVAVNRLVDTRSYTSLHALVHGMFPVMTSSEQEDFNSWNFWKLPPPDIDH